MSAAISVVPAVGLLDTPRHIVLSGFAPGEHVSLTARSRQADGSAWRSVNTYVADARGAIDLDRQAPVSGSYAGVDGQGPIWSQAWLPQPGEDSLAVPAPEGLAGAITVVLQAQGEHGARATANLVQRHAAEGVVRTPLSQDGLVGALFTPATPGPHPAIVFLNGSGGGVNEARAALFASHGYAALALGYFGAPGLPDHLSGIPLEYFERALAWLRATVRPAWDFVAVSGISRGGELSLLLGSEYPQAVSAVVAYVPSSVVHGVLNAGKPDEGRFATAWTRGGDAVAHVWEGNAAQDWSAIDSLPEPRRQAQAFVDAQRDVAAVARARIPVERIAGPVLLLSAGDDGYWPSSRYAEDVARTLTRAQHPHAVTHLDYPEAGHALQAPGVPTTRIAKPHPVSGIVLTGGGTPLANHRANQASWAGVLDFLKDAVAARARQAA